MVETLLMSENSTEFLTLAWPRSGCCGHLGNEVVDGNDALLNFISNNKQFLKLKYYPPPNISN